MHLSFLKQEVGRWYIPNTQCREETETISYGSLRHEGASQQPSLRTPSLDYDWLEMVTCVS